MCDNRRARKRSRSTHHTGSKRRDMRRTTVKSSLSGLLRQELSHRSDLLAEMFQLPGRQAQLTAEAYFSFKLLVITLLEEAASKSGSARCVRLDRAEFPYSFWCRFSPSQDMMDVRDIGTRNFFQRICLRLVKTDKRGRSGNLSAIVPKCFLSSYYVCR